MGERAQREVTAAGTKVRREGDGLLQTDAKRRKGLFFLITLTPVGLETAVAWEVTAWAN